MKDIKHNGFIIKIITDNDAADPRTEYDNLGTMVCWHKKYKLGDKHNYQNSDEFLTDNLAVNTAGNLQSIKDTAIILPLFLYDHSGITMSTKPFSCPWDSGQVGYIYVTREKLKSEGLDCKTDTEIEGYLQSEVNVYDSFMTGEVYGYQVLDKDGEMIDSCYGYYGDPEESGLIQSAKDTIDYYISEQRKAHFTQLKEWIRHKVPLLNRKPLQAS